MNYEKLVDQYIDSKKNAWGENTKLAARRMLIACDGSVVLSLKPEVIYEYLSVIKGLTPYSAKTYLIRIADFVDWGMEAGVFRVSKRNPIKLYMKENARLFKSVYAPQGVELTLDAVLKLIKKIPDEETRAKAGQLVRTGMRWEESFTLDKKGYVNGKGNAKRLIRTANPEDAEIGYTKTYQTFLVHLKQVGLKPHDLRKAHALWLAENGAHIGEIMAFMGWKSVQSAASYLQTASERKLTEKLKKKFKQEADE